MLYFAKTSMEARADLESYRSPGIYVCHQDCGNTAGVLDAGHPAVCKSPGERRAIPARVPRAPCCEPQQKERWEQGGKSGNDCNHQAAVNHLSQGVDVGLERRVRQEALERTW